MKRVLSILALLVGMCGASSPTLVAHFQAVDQSTSISTTTVYTATTTGSFRFNWYAECSNSTTSSPAMTLSWTDDHGSFNDGGGPFSLACSGTNVPISSGATVPIRMVSGSAFTVGISVPSGTPTYSVYVALEKLP